MRSEVGQSMGELIQERSDRIKDPAGREVEVLREENALFIARSCSASLFEVYRESLELGVYPLRYLRNKESISIRDQIRLAESRVAVTGAGGLGGHVIQSLARVGVGQLVVIDPDAFDETNLNRQAFSNRDSLGRHKVDVACEFLAAINPSVTVIPHAVSLDSANAREILLGSDVVVDALDNVPDRLVLEKAAQALGIPLVHGAIAGLEGQLTTVFPGDQGLKQIYGADATRKDPRSPEAVLGVPSVTPSLVAALQAVEVLKILLNRGRTFRKRMVHLDLENGKWQEFVLEE
jgi:molybdopterin-synthase adenylyltransferase